jgi:hypothetical protein
MVVFPCAPNGTEPRENTNANANDLQISELRWGLFSRLWIRSVAAAKNRATRLGGIPAGSLEVLGRLKSWSVEAWSVSQKLVFKLMTIRIAAEFFRVMSPIVSFVSSPLIFGVEIGPV